MVVQTERERRQAIIFLPPSSSPAEFFEDERLFFPAEENGSIRLYSRSSVASLILDGDDAPPGSLASHGIVYEERPVAIHLRNGTSIVGTLSALEGRTRTLDLVNEPGKSFAVSSDGAVVHVAKAHVEWIEEIR